MGYVAKYRAEAQEKNLPNWERFAIAEIEKTGEAILIYRNPHASWLGGKLHYTANEYPELPMTFPTYQEAFAWLERKLTMRAMDAWDSPAQLVLFSPEVLSTASAESQPAMRH